MGTSNRTLTKTGGTQLTDYELTVREFLAALRQAGRTAGTIEKYEYRLRTLGSWLAGRGVTAPDGRRTAPSAGALYPLEIYIVAARVDGLAPGVYHYEPVGHRLVPTADGDRIEALAHAALDQRWIGKAAAVLVIAAVESRTARKYGGRATRYVHIEVGHAAQNVLLQATAFGLAAAPVGAFDDRGVKALLALPREAEPLYLLPVGRPR